MASVRGDAGPGMRAWVQRGSYVALLAVVVGAVAVVAPAMVGADAEGFESDDFNVVSLDMNRWSEVDPQGDGTVSITGQGTGDASLSLAVPGGTKHDPWRTNTALRVMQDVPDEDIELEARFASEPTGRFQMHGFLVQEAPDRFVRYGLHHNGTSLRLYAATVGPSPVVHLDIPMASGAAEVLRVARTDHEWVLSYSPDGLTWTTATTFTEVLEVSEAGLFAGNSASGGAAPPAYTALVDYAFDTANPVEPEDAPATDPSPDTSPPVIGNVTVEPGVDSAVVTWTTDEPSTSAVAFGPTPGLDHSVANSRFDTEHALVLTGLSPETTYHYSVRSTNVSGLESTVGPTTFMTDPPPPAAGFVSDDFRNGISSSVWTEVDPLGDGTVEPQMGEDCAVGAALTVPEGEDHDPWKVNEALRIMQPVADTDLDLAAAFDTMPTERFQGHGLLIEESDGIYLRFSVHHTGSALRLYAATFADGLATKRYERTMSPDAVRVLRVTRQGDTWTLSYSSDGSDWAEAVTFAQPMVTTSAGVFSGNNEPGGGDPIPGYTAVVDWAFDMNSPVSLEDGGEACQSYDLDTAVAGSGSVTRSPNAASYPEGSQVTLSARPDPGWQFAGWSGAVSGQQNPATLTMTGPLAVTANFVQDTTPPVISDLAVEATDTSATVTWTTDDPASSEVAYGTTSGYGNGNSGDGEMVTHHMVTLVGLTPETTYHFRASSTNGAGLAAGSPDTTFTTGESTAPRIDVWYGDQQTFGANGQPQAWANVTGNVSDPDGVASLSYRLNGGPDRSLNMGSDLRRIYGAGDFNVELPYDQLNAGANEVQITAVDTTGQTSVKLVTVHRVTGVTPTLPFDTDWASASVITDRSQPVDGRWVLENGTIRAAEPGYDRTITFGDLSWSDYQVTTSITVHSFAEGYGTPQSGAPLVGIGLRWRGHSAEGYEQPRRSWWPTGAFAWFRWQGEPGRYELRGNWDDPVGRFVDPPVRFGTTYMFKAQARTLEDGSTEYAYKAWIQGTAEPGWQTTVVEPDGPASGGVVLVSHHVVANWGDLEVTPLEP